eukprot:Nitzschia sp. Nitz4//scaffold114_size70088//46835//47485//NITZ4_005982-RA/size70088-processed-gene-0.37-mRNA-1//-1//CDS//3329533438//5725//frame0
MGQWVGDVIVRDHFDPRASIVAPKGESWTRHSFGLWSPGVQRHAWAWHIAREVGEEMLIQSGQYGKSLGNGVASCLGEPVFGTVLLEASTEVSSTSNDLTYIDWSGGSFGILAGSVGIRAPRSLDFNNDVDSSEGPILNPFNLLYTEFAVFYEEAKPSKVSYPFVQSLPDCLSCSKLSRLYDVRGMLLQGSSSFYNQEPMAEETKKKHDIIDAELS